MTTEPARGETKTVEILGSIRAIFASKGFDGASMQDLAQAAGMSAGNFYRYFPSKNAIIEALIERHVDEVREDFAQVMVAERPLQAIAELIRLRVESKDACDAPIMAEIRATACRRPETADLLARMEQEVTGGLVAAFAKVMDIPESAAKAQFSAHAQLIFLLVRGITMHVGSNSGAATKPDRDLAALVLRTIERTLDDVAACAASNPKPDWKF